MLRPMGHRFLGVWDPPTVCFTFAHVCLYIMLKVENMVDGTMFDDGGDSA